MTEPGPPAAPAKRRPPLDGVRILAVSQFGAGPFGTQVLADLGAEVIKIEDPGVGGDVARYVPPFAGEADSPYFQSFNRGKRSITLNLRHPDGQAVLHDLVRVSDARMSGTAFGTCVLHVAPESWVGGPLALVRSGDPITLNVAERVLRLDVDDAELARRRAAWQPPQPRYSRGYGALFSEQVTQANEGCDFEFLARPGSTPDPQPNPQ